MKPFMHCFWLDEDAFVVSTEIVLIASILVIGMLVGLVSIRDQIVQEVVDVAAAMSKGVQSYSFAGITGHSASLPGSQFSDRGDYCDQGEVGCDVTLCVSVNTLIVDNEAN